MEDVKPCNRQRCNQLIALPAPCTGLDLQMRPASMSPCMAYCSILLSSALCRSKAELQASDIMELNQQMNNSEDYFRIKAIFLLDATK